ncbi:AAA domain (dynein-related subfamily) [Amycolatopsis tolypomycina]|uniref:AAA domain (Dynein-related subfamily) n=1 Tax=Amycolatopsis tolypomycina TaxID=208445 RepID=A0A1H4SVC8_9PSEU|nr:MoxR family ATPase [Amycolatopsis tolypomycina]SEC48133.1 AAA domain (dynein-related subfamily) [Amycolatopsis tolypomycina]
MSSGQEAASPVPPWWIYRGTGEQRTEDIAELLPPPPPWRAFDGEPVLPVPPAKDAGFARRLGRPGPVPMRSDPQQVELINAAICLRRPLLVTGAPGTGKSSLAYRIAQELRLGPVLYWPISTRSSLGNGLYEYDAIGRVQAASALAAVRDGNPASAADVGDFVRLGPLGTALLAYEKPRVLLIDELDKSDIDLPNDLLAVLEEGEYFIPELARLASRTPEVRVFTHDLGESAVVRSGVVRCRAFPIIVITSNGERQFPPAFLRRCIRLDLPNPDVEQLAGIVAAHLPRGVGTAAAELIEAFAERSAAAEPGLPVDQLLNALYLVTSGNYDAHDESWPRLVDALWRQLSAPVD